MTQLQPISNLKDKCDVTQLDLLEIVAQASSISERLNNSLFNLDISSINQQKINERLEYWCQVTSQGDWEKFQKRLQWDGLDIDVVYSVLGSSLLVNDQILPNWAQTLQTIIQISSNFAFQDVTQAPEDSKNPTDPENPLPFEDVLLPAIRVARQKLLTFISSVSLSSEYLPLELLCEKAYLSLERSLLQKLVNLCGRTLEFEFTHSRSLGHNLLTFLVGENQVTYSKIHYNNFVEKLLEDGLLAFFRKYPVLGRLVATTINFWVETTSEFLQRLKSDILEIKKVFNYPTNSYLGKVIEIETSLSDSHNHGRSVIALTFESGVKLVYKPKNIGTEITYNQFLDWCNQRNIPLKFKVLKVIDCQKYGWAEYVEQHPCEDLAAAQRFYQRAGMLLCIMYALGGTDCIYENLIADGEHPMLIDTETLVYHEACPITNSQETIEAQSTAIQQFCNSVFRTGLLPCWQFDKDNRIAFDVSGLGSVEPQLAPRLMPRWQSINTDYMQLKYESVTIPINRNVPILNGFTLSPNDYLDQIVEGFKQMYHFLTEQREPILAAASPIATLQKQWVRFVVRKTRVYTILMQRTLAPEFLRNGVDRSIELDVLSRAFLISDHKPNAWPILQAEIRAIEQLDVPYFGSAADSDDLAIESEQTIKKYFEEPSYNQLLWRFKNLNKTDLQQQLAIIHGAFNARIAHQPRSRQLTVFKASESDATDCLRIRSLSSEDLLLKAQDIAQEIYQTVLYTSNNRPYWIGLDYIRNADRFQLEPLNDSLNYGSCGVALFLTALDQMTGGTQFRQLAVNSLESLRRVLQVTDAKSTPRFVQSVGIGGTQGLGSIIYSLVKISQFLQDASFLEDAQRSASLITPELIASDQKLHLMEGSAGGILGLLALYHETTEPTVLDQAIACGQHLLKHRVSIDDAPRAWKTSAEKPLTGFSCGAAGIAYALLRLYEVTSDEVYLEAAKEAIAYERSVFSTAVGNWPDFRYSDQKDDQLKFAVNWSHGAPGIGLARLGSLSILETEEIHQDVKVALQTTQQYSLQDLDNLCYGNFGRIEVLLVASQKLSRPQLQETAQKQAAWLVLRAEQTGGYKMLDNLPSHRLSPSFLQGTAGIGYELLRLAYPGTLPSILLWE